MRNCCCIRWNDALFARNDQARLILNRAFEGRQFFVEGAHGNTIDCMFFPCSTNEQVQFENPSHDLLYLEKPTVIMCNPNAQVYQQMVVAQNAYWLNFFLKREINVVCWNYRGYGESSIGMLDFLNPMKAKIDAERVLARAVQLTKVRGKIGVFGRSIGGITACHLAAKYNDLVELLVIDRSLDELLNVVE